MLAMSHPRKLVSVLYKKRKFADRQTDRQTKNVSKTEVHSIPLWILSGYTRELANKYVRIVQYTIVQYNTLQYIKLRYSIEAPNKYLYCTVLFRTVLYKKEKICRQADRQTRNVSKTEVHSTRELANFVAFNVSDESSAKVSICTV